MGAPGSRRARRRQARSARRSLRTSRPQAARPGLRERSGARRELRREVGRSATVWDGLRSSRARATGSSAAWRADGGGRHRGDRGAGRRGATDRRLSRPVAAARLALTGAVGHRRARLEPEPRDGGDRAGSADRAKAKDKGKGKGGGGNDRGGDGPTPDVPATPSPDRGHDRSRRPTIPTPRRSRPRSPEPDPEPAPEPSDKPGTPKQPIQGAQVAKR